MQNGAIGRKDEKGINPLFSFLKGYFKKWHVGNKYDHRLHNICNEVL